MPRIVIHEGRLLPCCLHSPSHCFSPPLRTQCSSLFSTCNPSFLQPSPLCTLQLSPLLLPFSPPFCRDPFLLPSASPLPSNPTFLLCFPLPFSAPAAIPASSPPTMRPCRSDADGCILLLLFALSWLAMASASFVPENLLKGATRRTEPGWGMKQQISWSGVQRHLRLTPNRRVLAGNASTWQTLNGSPPLVIARGGSSGLFPDQTTAAYYFAINNSLSGSAVFCDLQLTKDGYGMCRTGINLGASTNVNLTFPQLQKEYDVNGAPVQGFFSIDLTAAQVFNNLTATQSNGARSPYYDYQFLILQPADVASLAKNSTLMWINIEYANFFTQHKLNISSYVLSMLSALPIDYISSPEVAFLKAIKTGVPKNTPNLVLRFHHKDEVDPSTNVTYGSLLNDLKTVATYASGILVPKDYIWPVDNTTSYLGSETTLIKEAHDAGLAIYASEFVNDASAPIYNYSFDPVREYLQYVPTTGSNVDGFLTDFPSTASEALACFRSSASVNQSGTKPFVISHNGASGDYPGCTLLAYRGAVQGGASHVDCPIQITKDGIVICRESPNLLSNTDVSLSNFFPSRTSVIPQLQSTPGLYSFNMTWEEITTLKARIFSPEQDSSGLKRNPAYTQESIIRLSDFLSYAKNTSVGILVDIQNGYFLETEVGLDVVGSVLSSLNAAGLNNSDRVVIQSEDSAVLQRLQQLTNYQLVYKVTSADVVITKTEVLQIKGLATYVTLPRGLIQGTNTGYLLNGSDVVSLFHAQNMSVFISYLRNEFVAIPFDYEADPTLELNTIVQYFKVDGVVTDFPATASAYLSNGCLNLKTEAGGLSYSIRFVVPGELATNIPPSIPAASPPSGGVLNVTEGEAALPPFSPRASPGSSSSSNPPSSTPAASPSTASHWHVPHILILITTLVTAFHTVLH